MHGTMYIKKKPVRIFSLIFFFVKMVNEELELGKGILAQKNH